MEMSKIALNHNKSSLKADGCFDLLCDWNLDFRVIHTWHLRGKEKKGERETERDEIQPRKQGLAKRASTALYGKYDAKRLVHLLYS